MKRKQFLRALLAIPFIGKVSEVVAKNIETKDEKKWYWQRIKGNDFAQWKAGTTHIQHIEGDGFYCNNPAVYDISWWAVTPYLSGYGELKGKYEITIKAETGAFKDRMLFRETMICEDEMVANIKNNIAKVCSRLAYYIDQKYPIKSGGETLKRVHSHYFHSITNT